MTPNTNPLAKLSAALLEQEHVLRAAVETNDDAAIEAAADQLFRACLDTLAELKRATDLVSAYTLALPTHRSGNA